MNNAAASFSAEVLDIGYVQMVIAQTGPDTASLDERVWPAGSDGEGPPTSQNVYQLTNIRAFGNTVTCKAKVSWWLHAADVSLVLSDAGQQPSAILAEKSLVQSKNLVLPLSSADWQGLVDFRKAANFPVA